MKKRFVMALVLLASISMLLSSFARASEAADDIDTMCTTAQTQYLNNLQKEIADDRALLAQAPDEDSKDLLTAKLWDLEKQLKDMNEVNCP